MNNNEIGIDLRTIKCACGSEKCGGQGISFDTDNDGTPLLRFHFNEKVALGLGILPGVHSALTQRESIMHLDIKSIDQLLEELEGYRENLIHKKELEFAEKIGIKNNFQISDILKISYFAFFESFYGVYIKYGRSITVYEEEFPKKELEELWESVKKRSKNYLFGEK